MPSTNTGESDELSYGSEHQWPAAKHLNIRIRAIYLMTPADLIRLVHCLKTYFYFSFADFFPSVLLPMEMEYVYQRSVSFHLFGISNFMSFYLTFVKVNRTISILSDENT